MFYALTHGKIETGNIRFREHLEGIEALNERAERKEFEITAVSVHQLYYIHDSYRLMNVGASMGDGYGPLVVGRNGTYLPGRRVALPGRRTTAALLFQLRFGTEAEFAVYPFDDVMRAVREEECDYGVVIHEGQLSYREEGMIAVEDLGRWFTEETGLPTPLGVNVVRRDLSESEEMDRLLRTSIAWAFENEEEALDYALQYARGLEKDSVRKFVRMYVNDLTIDLGERGRNGVRELIRRGIDRGFLRGTIATADEIFL
ncbi:MAG: ABC transporter substrate-binding protein [Candidatus Hydrogenedentota bacterium]|nr:MAG: ABC transporter substrate-binding protein [Candidatus Hydrogenedentota bacterium]